MRSFPEISFNEQMQRYVADIPSLADEFQRRFHDFATIEKDIMLFPLPFSADPDNAPGNLQMELIELQSDAECRSRQQQLLSLTFTVSWIKTGSKRY